MLSFLIYELCLLFPFFVWLVVQPCTVKGRFASYLVSFSPTFLFATLRGNAGTDTENYRELYELMEPALIGVDPIFSLLALSVKAAGGGFQAFAFVQAGLTIFLYSIGAAYADRRVPLFGLGLLPVLVLDSTFNGLRYGLAFAVASVTLALWTQRKSVATYLGLLTPGLVHSSGLLFALVTPWSLLGLFLAGGVYWMDSSQLLALGGFVAKAEAYAEVQRPSVFSGAFPVAQALMLWAIARMTGVRMVPGINMLTVGVAVFVGGVCVAVFSYAGLRFMHLGIFMLTFAVSISAVKVSRQALQMVLLLGMFAVLNFSRQIFLSGPAGGVFFHPYDFYFLSL